MAKDFLVRLLFLLGFIFNGLYDAVSTVMAANYLSTYQYESSGILRAVGMSSGTLGFVVMKLGVALLALWFALYLAEHFSKFKIAAIGILSGAILAGMFVGTSNLNIIWNGHSIFLFGLDASFVGTAIIVMFGLSGILIGLGTPDNDMDVSRHDEPLKM